MPDIIQAAERWRDADIDPDTGSRLEALLTAAAGGDQVARTELESAFAGPLEFGTAGLRGPLGPGPGRMNRVVVTQAASGFAAWLTGAGLGGGKVIVGYDARHKSHEFALDTAEILSGAGFEPLLLERATPTPVVAFGIQHYGCVAGVVVTASHNPATDNGYKVYLGDGSQIVPPVDGEIAEQIAKAAARPVRGLVRGYDITPIGDDLVAAYVAHGASLVSADTPRDVAWVYTAMHGVGASVMLRLADAAGFPAATSVAEQLEPDPDFPTVGFPNPEEPGALDLAMGLVAAARADVVIANDPDADRCAVAALIDGAWRMLTGDELGALLGDDALRRRTHGVYASSIVSSSLLQRMAEANGQPYQGTLTGFKWIGRVPGLAFGYEEAIGYCCDPATVPDKDGMTAALRVLALTASLKAQGQTLADRLETIARHYGLHTTAQLSVRVDDRAVITDAMSGLRRDPPALLGGEAVHFADLNRPAGALPATDAVELSGDSVHVVVRPSGTEPKLKCYLEVRLSPAESQDVRAARAVAEGRMAGVRSEMAAALGIA